MRRLLLAIVVTAACSTAADHADQSSTPARAAAGTIAADSGRASARDSAPKQATPTPVPSASQAAPAAASRTSDAAPPVVRALYVNRWATQSKKRMAKLLAAADSTEINAFVIDISGR